MNNYEIARTIKQELRRRRSVVPKCFTLGYIRSIYEQNYNMTSEQYIKHGGVYCTMLEVINEHRTANAE
jgi:hypothetical protein